MTCVGHMWKPFTLSPTDLGKLFPEGSSFYSNRLLSLLSFGASRFFPDSTLFGFHYGSRTSVSSSFPRDERRAADRTECVFNFRNGKRNRRQSTLLRGLLWQPQLRSLSIRKKNVLLFPSKCGKRDRKVGGGKKPSHNNISAGSSTPGRNLLCSCDYPCE